MNGVTVYINSWDNYAKYWPPMYHSLKKYWPDCPWNQIVISNRKESDYFDTITTGESTNWSEMTRRALDKIETPVILFMCEDYWLTESVLTQPIIQYAKLIENKHVDHIRLIPSGEIKGNFSIDERLAIFNDNAMYRTSLNAGLWRVDTFKNLLRERETIWEFETQASIRSRGNDRFLCVKKFECMKYITDDAVEKGILTKAGQTWLDKEGLVL